MFLHAATEARKWKHGKEDWASWWFSKVHHLLWYFLLLYLLFKMVSLNFESRLSQEAFGTWLKYMHSWGTPGDWKPAGAKLTQHQGKKGILQQGFLPPYYSPVAMEMGRGSWETGRFWLSSQFRTLPFSATKMITKWKSLKANKQDMA